MEAADEWRDEITASIKDLSTRIHKLERYIWIAFGAIAVLQFLGPFFADKVKP